MPKSKTMVMLRLVMASALGFLLSYPAWACQTARCRVQCLPGGTQVECQASAGGGNSCTCSTSTTGDCHASCTSGIPDDKFCTW